MLVSSLVVRKMDLFRDCWAIVGSSQLSHDRFNCSMGRKTLVVLELCSEFMVMVIVVKGYERSNRVPMALMVERWRFEIVKPSSKARWPIFQAAGWRNHEWYKVYVILRGATLSFSASALKFSSPQY